MLLNQAYAAFFYVLFGGVILAAILALIAMILLPMLRHGRDRYFSCLFRSTLFAALIFFWGGIANGVWFALPTERWYFQADTLFRYFPIIPFSSWYLDEACGGHLLPGVSMLRLQMLWGLFTIGVWSLSLLCYSRMKRLDWRRLILFR